MRAITDAVTAALYEPVRPQDASFAINGEPTTPRMHWLVDGIRQVMRAKGHPEDAVPSGETTVVVHLVDHDRPKPYRRKEAPTFVLAVVEAPEPPASTLKAGYPFLVRALSNLCMYNVPNGDRLSPSFITLEQGVYPLGVDPMDDEAFFDAVYERVAPLALSRLVIDNEFVPDLHLDLWGGTDVTRQITRAGQRLDALNLLPAPFPLHEILSEREMRHVMKLYGIGGLSYGNVSARHDESTFWMSASGVDKSKMENIGEHILLVTDFDVDNRRIKLSVPPGVAQPRRVSVDAIEHWMIYREHPDVGAILHVHAWIPGIPSTEINYPCGTVELARSVAGLVRDSASPAAAVVGQRNHGMTITGTSLDEIFERVGGLIVPQVPMS